MSRIVRPTALALALAACGAPPRPAPVPETPETVAEPPDGHARLGEGAVPRRYVLDLSVDPAETRFRGEAAIEVALAAPTDHVVLHGGDFAFEKAVAVAGGAERAATPVAGRNGGLALQFAEPLPAGVVTLRFAWTAPLPEVPTGLYRVREGDRWYAFTQFEPLEARDVFPCFDEPRFKTPFAVTLRVPEGDVALANAPETGRRVEGGRAVFTFAETKPLPTYLVAFAAGPFDLVGEGDRRVVATRGKGRLAAYMLERTPVVLGALVDWFGSPYPFEKLDQVAVPNFRAGAMENVGLVTYRETLLLLDPAEATPADRFRGQSVMAHELAHQWFGNLVTPAWWDDLWLNESFATWMAGRTMRALWPEYGSYLDAALGKTGVMNLDAQKDARAVRQPIRDGGDVYNAFDGITYGKGAALLHMFEQWIGPEVFQRGVRQYLADHAHGVATTDDLLRALDAASGKPVGATMRRFLDQPGVPLVQADVACGAQATLTLRQSRYLPAGSDAPQGEPWTIPVCVRSDAGRACFVLDAPEKTFPLAKCPAWLHPNADEDGYYRWRVPPEALRALLTTHRARLTPRETAALPDHLRALLLADAVDLDTYLDGLTALAAEPGRQVIGGVTGGLATLHHVAVDASNRAAFAAFVRGLLGPHLRRVGVEPKAGEPLDARLVRPMLVRALAGLGDDAALGARGLEVARRFVADPDAVPAVEVEQWLAIGARDADAALWEGLVAAAERAATPDKRAAAIAALGAVAQPGLLQRSLGLVLDGTLRAQDWRTLLGGLRDEPAVRDAVWSWFTGNYDALVARLGAEAAPRLPSIGAGFCNAGDRARVAAFFADPRRAPDGTARNLGLALESIDRCVRLNERTARALATRLARPHH
jgi:alanyl aminopeptidase